MAHVWSESNKIVNSLIPVADAFTGTKNTDIIDLEGYKKCTFVVITGATSTGSTTITVNAGASSTGASTAIIYRYRTMIAGTPPAAASDVPSALTVAGTGGFTTTISKPGGMYIIEVDAAVVADAGTDYDHVKLTLTESVDEPITGSVLAILSEPRNPQGVLPTAIG